VGDLVTKRKPGRPLKNDTHLSESVTLRLTEREMQNLKDYCFVYGYTVSDVVRWALDTLSVTGL